MRLSLMSLILSHLWFWNCTRSSMQSKLTSASSTATSSYTVTLMICPRCIWASCSALTPSMEPSTAFKSRRLSIDYRPLNKTTSSLGLTYGRRPDLSQRQISTQQTTLKERVDLMHQMIGTSREKSLPLTVMHKIIAQSRRTLTAYSIRRTLKTTSLSMERILATTSSATIRLQVKLMRFLTIQSKPTS